MSSEQAELIWALIMLGVVLTYMGIAALMLGLVKLPGGTQHGGE